MVELINKIKGNWFLIISVIITLIVALFIVSSISVILFSGVSKLVPALKNDEVIFSIKLSLFTATISTFICMFLSIPTAYILSRISFPFKKILELVLEITMSMPYLVLGLSLLIIFSSDLGKALRDIGFKVVFDTKGIIIAHLLVNLPYTIRIVKTSFNNVDIKLEKVAGLLGASRWKIFTTIILPISKNGLLNAFILTFSRALGEFGATLMLVGVTKMKTETLPACIFLNISTGNNSLAMGVALILLILSAILLIISYLINKDKSYKKRFKVGE